MQEEAANSICLQFTTLPNGLINSVHQHKDSKWYFVTETWADCIGPYETEEIALMKAKKYGEQL